MGSFGKSKRLHLLHVRVLRELLCACQGLAAELNGVRGLQILLMQTRYGDVGSGLCMAASETQIWEHDPGLKVLCMDAVQCKL